MILRHESEVAHILQIAIREVAFLIAAAQDRFDNAPHALFSELVGQLVEMRFAAQDELLFRLNDSGSSDGIASLRGTISEAGLICQGVDQPRLPLCLMPDRLQLRRA